MTTRLAGGVNGTNPPIQGRRTTPKDTRSPQSPGTPRRVPAPPATNTARLEDLAWMTEHGETLNGAATRLGLTRDGLQQWAKRNAPDLLRVLTERDERNRA